MNEVWVHRYRLRSRGDLNAAESGRGHRGALLRVGEGVGCLHPWEALGDDPLEVQLAALCEGRGTLQAERALECAVIDGRARALGRSVFETISIPKSHALVSEEEGFRRRLEEGFTTFKLKCGRDLEAEGSLVALVSETPGIRLRLDFNEMVSADGFGEFWAALPEAARRCVEYVEDPCPYDPVIWSGIREQRGVSLAVDRAVERAESGYDVMVLKPAVDRVHELMPRAVARGVPVVFTSYMDHPVGQMYAALEAGLAKWAWPDHVGICGLLTHELFVGDSFCEAASSKGPQLLAPAGTGLGFDDLLGALEWERLI
jgi:O-succinylbenzoate synthase